MELVRDEPSWRFTGFPGFGSQHLRVWRTSTGVLVAVVLEVLGPDENNIAGTNLLEAHELVLAQLHVDHPGATIDYILCERRLGQDFDTFSRITLHPDRTETQSVLLTNHVIDHLGAHGLYRRYEGYVVRDSVPRLDPDDSHRMPGC